MPPRPAGLSRGPARRPLRVAARRIETTDGSAPQETGLTLSAQDPWFRADPVSRLTRRSSGASGRTG